MAKSTADKKKFPRRSLRRRLQVIDGILPLGQACLEGSDYRRKDEEKKGICCLCDEESLLQYGHVIPKWTFREAMREGSLVGLHADIGVKTTMQDGLAHYLLCFNCEQFLSLSEKYARNLSLGSIVEKKNLGISKITTSINFETIYGINARLIHCFVLGTAFRAHHAVSAPFAQHRFPDRHYIELKQSLLRHRAGLCNQSDLDRFPVYLIKFTSNLEWLNTRDVVMVGYNTPPLVNWSKFFFMAGGYEWGVFIDEPRNFKLEPLIWLTKANEGKPMIIPISIAENDPAILDTVKQYTSRLISCEGLNSNSVSKNSM